VICNNRIIFVHVPKTGGTSVRRALMARYPDMVMPQAFHTALRSAKFKTSDKFAFGFMRNPWERMVSHYRFMCQKPAGPNDHKVYKRQSVIDMGFKEWAINGRFGEEIYKAVGEFEAALSVHHISQMWWLRGCNFIGRFERLQEDADEAMRQIGEPPLLLPHLQKTMGGDYRDEYDDELREFIGRLFAEDIEVGGYTFDGTGEPT